MPLDVKEIEKAVAALPADGYRRFSRWFLDRDWKAWDESIADDSDAGRLDFLLKEARGEKDHSDSPGPRRPCV